MPLQVAFLHKGTVAVLAMEGSLASVHTNVSIDAEEFGVASSTVSAF